MAERDPLIGAHFALDVDGVVSAFFKEATGFNNSSEVITHQAVDKEGRSVRRTRRWPGSISLKAGLRGGRVPTSTLRTKPWPSRRSP